MGGNPFLLAGFTPKKRKQGLGGGGGSVRKHKRGGGGGGVGFFGGLPPFLLKVPAKGWASNSEIFYYLEVSAKEGDYQRKRHLRGEAPGVLTLLATGKGAVPC